MYGQPHPSAHRPPPIPHPSTQVLGSLARGIGEDEGLIRDIGHNLENAENGKQLVALLQKSLEAASANTCQLPTAQQLHRVALVAAIPFVGFGILDNMLMILCGDWIDTTLCVSFGFSTMLAAALGNTVSDAAGVFSGGIVEDWANSYGFEAPKLTRSQEALPVTKNWERLGQLFGVVVGCIIGMCPLLFIDSHKAEKLKQSKRTDEMYQSVVEGVSDMLEAEAAMLMLVDDELGELYTRASEGIPEFRCPVGEGVKGAVAAGGKFINIEDIRGTQYYMQERHDSYQGSDVRVVSLLCMPIIGPDNKVLGVVEVINKLGAPHFTEKDEDVLSAVCSHISTAISSVDGSEHAFKQTMELCERSLKNQGTRLNSAQNARIDYLFHLVMDEVTSALEVEAAQLLVLDKEANELYTKSSSNVPAFRTPVGYGIMGRVVEKGEVMCINHIEDSEYYDKGRHTHYQGTSLDVTGVLCHPIIDSNHDVIGVIEVLNKIDGEFTKRDISFLSAVASHLALNMQGPGTSLKSILRMLATQQRREMEIDGQAVADKHACLLSLLSGAFSEVDENGDGFISKEEFEAAALKILEAEKLKSEEERKKQDAAVANFYAPNRPQRPWEKA